MCKRKNYDGLLSLSLQCCFLDEYSFGMSIVIMNTAQQENNGVYYCAAFTLSAITDAHFRWISIQKATRCDCCWFSVGLIFFMFPVHSIKLTIPKLFPFTKLFTQSLFNKPVPFFSFVFLLSYLIISLYS